jgi:hypothetical protein
MYPAVTPVSCPASYCMLKFRCVVLVQDRFILNYSQKTPYVQPYSGSLPASYSFSTGVIPRGRKLTTHLHRIPRLGICAAVPLHPLYAFTAWARKTSLNPLPRSTMLSYTENPFPSYPSTYCLCHYTFVLHVSKIYMLCILYQMLK